MTIEEQLAYLTRGCVEVVRVSELRTKLERAERTGTPLVVKVGFDPTAPDLHLGHTVLIRKMKHFQDLGHTVIYVVGAFTALIGDPTGRSKTRPPLTPEEIAANAETYKTQVFKILDPAKTVVRFNSEWLEPLGSIGWIRLAARYNVAQMLERREFKMRYDAGKPIAVHEFLYSLAQAYDSVELRADVELGGTDQLFNLNVGRDIMPGFGLEPQVVMTTPLLEGLDGVEKMSKSLGNYVGVTENASDMFGKLMSISDDLMWKYYALLTDLGPVELRQRREGVAAGASSARGPLSSPTQGSKPAAGSPDLHPKASKIELASRVVADFHGQAAAALAAEEFERRFSRKELPTELPVVEHRVEAPARTLERLLADHGYAASGSDAARKVKQGGVKRDGARFTTSQWHLSEPGEYVIEVGRRAFRLRVVE